VGIPNCNRLLGTNKSVITNGREIKHKIKLLIKIAILDKKHIVI